MNFTLDDYRDCVKLLCDGCTDLGDGIVSVIVYGSLAIGTIQPGKSDILDALVVVKDELLADKTAYARMLLRFADVCVALSARGLPFHPFHYYAQSELKDRFPVLYQAQWVTDGYSEVAMGMDVRPDFVGGMEDWLLIRSSYFAQRRVAQRLARYAGRADDIAKHPRGPHGALCNFARISPRLACEALGFHVVEQEMVPTLNILMPSLEPTIFSELRAFCKQETCPPDQLREHVVLALELSEKLHVQLMSLLGR
jgi:hypothetical protein